MSSLITCGDCLQELPKLQENSIDLLVTDPPYGYSFMGKDWDKAVPSVDIWKQCLRVLKPGAFAYIMSSPRQDVLCKMTLNLIEAGFETNFTSLYWCYASGFPKAANVGKLADKRNGRFENERKQLALFIKEKIINSGYSDIDIRKYLNISLKGGGLIPHWTTQSAQPTVPNKEHWLKLKEIIPDLGNEWDWFIEREEAEREVMGHRHDGVGSISKSGIYELNNAKSTMSRDIDITIPHTDAAKQLDGSYAGYQPKPAVEIILVAMKPLSEKTFVDQALSNQKGITWLDDTKIPYDKMPDNLTRHNRVRNNIYDHGKGLPQCDIEINKKGRFPANLLVSDDVLNDGRNHKVGVVNATTFNVDDKIYGGGKGYRKKGQIRYTTNYGDSGSFSRYFSLDTWAEKTLPFLICPKASRVEKNNGLEGIHLEKRLEPVIEKETKFIRKNEPAYNEIALYLSEAIKHSGLTHRQIKERLGFPVDSGLVSHWIGMTGTRQDNLPSIDIWFKLKEILGFDDKYDKQMTEVIEVPKSDTIKITKFPQTRTNYEEVITENRHPTVKPLKLMSYLVTMGSRPNDTVLDPFAGSGTTGIAALQLGRKFIGYEISKEYCQIAERRLKPYLEQKTLI